MPYVSKYAEGDLRFRFVARFLRFKWATLSASVVFLAIYAIHLWLAQHGFRREARVGDDCLVALLFLALLIVQQLRQERELRRHAEMTRIIADMNHHTRNALQVIVDRAYEKKPVQEREALDEILVAVKRIQWCLNQILPNVVNSTTRRPPLSDSARGRLGTTEKSAPYKQP